MASYALLEKQNVKEIEKVDNILAKIMETSLDR